MVHKTDDESINGTKTFLDSIYHIVGEEKLDFKQVNTDIMFDVSPSSIQHVQGFNGNCYDSNRNIAQLSYYSAFVTTSASTYVRIGARRNAADADYEIVQLIATTNPAFEPSSNGAMTLGDSSHKWKQLYASTTTISTSDARLKTNVDNIPEEVLDAWGDLNFVQFKMVDAVNEKGQESARLHSGLIAQEIQSAFQKYSIDASKYGFFCHDTWDYSLEQKDKDGSVIFDEQQAGDEYSLRYEEALCMEAAYQRRENRRLKEKVASLEERLANLESKLNIS